jgi:predicted phage tail protein
LDGSCSTCTSAPPGIPTGLIATAASDQQINLRWSTATNVDYYQIERLSATSGPFVSGPGTYTPIGTSDRNTPSFTDKNLSASTNYSYRVRAINITGMQSTPSNEANATTQATPTVAPAAPSNLIATASAATIINLTWSDNSSNESGFKLERSANGGTTYTLIAIISAGGTSFVDVNLNPSSTYTYRVRATNAVGDSANSTPANATTLAAVNMATYSYLSVNVIASNCVSCHAGFGSYNGIRAIGNDFYNRTASGSMPPGNPLPAATVQAIKAWIDSGAPNN